MEKNKPVIDQTLFDLKLNEAKFYSDQGLYDEADKIYLQLINELKQLPETKSSNIQIRQLESIRQDYQTETGQDRSKVKKTHPSVDEKMSDLADSLSLVSESVYIEESSFDNNTDNQVTLFVNEMIIQAHQRDATAIHIEPLINSRNVIIRFRIGGICKIYTEITNKLALHAIFRIKIMANIDITLRAKTLYGKIRFKSKETGAIDLSVITLPTIGSREDVVLKFSKILEPMTLQALGFTEHNRGLFLDILDNRTSGLILVAGPADSGITTTLHSALELVNTPEKKICSAENPVEIDHKGIRQTEIQPDKGLDYPSLLKAFMLASSDVIMLGDLEEYKTVSLAIKASLTGHLLFGALNALDAADAVRKILETGVNPIHFADSLVCVVAMRVAGRLCEKCRQPSSDTIQMLADEFGEDPLGFLDNLDKDNIVIYGHCPDGCPDCGYTGYKGKVGIHELLVNSDAIKSVIKDSSDQAVFAGSTHNGRESQKSALQKIDDAVKILKSTAASHKIYSLKQDGILKVMMGITDMAQIRRKCV
ncbi:MAG: Flp pilus assembly complex ATPase component TadA [Desulfamplus sp.]|nr:Flp pilus assembly complex ATPase component TadA [Desulfamplus sp.]